MNIGKERRTIIIEPVEAPARESEPQPEAPQEVPVESRPVEEPVPVSNR